jgi:hypothetical protein
LTQREQREKERTQRKVKFCEPRTSNLEPRTTSHFCKRIAMAGMNEFHAAAARDNAKVVRS